jgi:hypothetical protein
MNRVVALSFPPSAQFSLFLSLLHPISGAARKRLANQFSDYIALPFTGCFGQALDLRVDIGRKSPTNGHYFFLPFFIPSSA